MAERVTTAKEDQISKFDKQRGTDTTLTMSFTTVEVRQKNSLNCALP